MLPDPRCSYLVGAIEDAMMLLQTGDNFLEMEAFVIGQSEC